MKFRIENLFLAWLNMTAVQVKLYSIYNLEPVLEFYK